MIYVNSSSCKGCGECVPVCPTGAIRLENDVAVVEQTGCTQCQACLAACPEGAIFSVTEPVANADLPAERRVPETIRVQLPQPVQELAPETRPASWGAKVLGAAAGALVAFGRELPRIVPALLDALDQHSRQSSTSAVTRGSASQAAGNGRGGRGRRRHRHRQRGR